MLEFEFSKLSMTYLKTAAAASGLLLALKATAVTMYHA